MTNISTVFRNFLHNIYIYESIYELFELYLLF